jgi:hypothetical protein
MIAITNIHPSQNNYQFTDGKIVGKPHGASVSPNMIEHRSTRAVPYPALSWQNDMSEAVLLRLSLL